MSESKDNQKDSPKLQDKKSAKNNRNKFKIKGISLPYTNQKCLELCPWILITVGLCVIVTISYMVIGSNRASEPTNVQIVENHTNSNIFEDSEDVSDNPFTANHFGTKLSLRNSLVSESTSIDYLSDEIEHNLNSCRAIACSVTCEDVSDIYTALHDTIKDSTCSSIDELMVKKQEFHLGILKNKWIPFNITFKNVSISFSQIITIDSNAFNSTLFRDTSSLTLNNKNIINMMTDALLGFHELDSLAITAPMKKFEPAVLQSVKKTLKILYLNANLKINGNKNLFDGNYFYKLETLDLSYNNFNGSLGKNLFESTLNLKVLIIKESQIEDIEDDAFVNVADKLIYIDLSKNHLTTLAAAALMPFFANHNEQKLIKLGNNNWICNCQLEEFANLFKHFRSYFGDSPICTAPDHLYGKHFDNLDFRKENCSLLVSMYHNSVGDGDITTATDKSTKSYQDSTEMLNILCLKNTAGESTEPKDILLSDNSDYISIPPPNYDFKLKLITENNSVVVSVDNSADVLVIWFSDQLESSVVNYGDMALDYECRCYTEPKLIVGPLQENTTYTFCLLPSLHTDISPFNCLPLFLPPRSNENIWISKHERHFTIGMLCLIFLLSTIAGAVIAYFGIRTYPSLLKGSKNVLVVKNSNEAYYLPTISEAVYQKQSLSKENMPVTSQHSLTKLPLPKIPAPEAPGSISSNDLDALYSVKSTSTGFEDIPPRYSFVDNDYETPKVCNSKATLEQRNSVPNTYCMTPNSPPPLPKRNSYVSNRSTSILNRLLNN